MKLFESVHWRLRTGMTKRQRQHGDIILSDGTVKTVQRVEQERAAARTIQKMSAEERAQLLEQLMEGDEG